MVVTCISVVSQSHVNTQAYCEIDLEFGCVVDKQNVKKILMKKKKEACR